MSHTPADLQKALLSEFMKQLENGTVVMDKEGQPFTVSPPPALLTAATGFLKAFPPDPKVAEPKGTSPLLAGTEAAFTPRVVQ